MGGGRSRYDILVVGAGAAGLFLAKFASGLDIALLEEHEKVGEPVHCAGLVGVRGMEALGVDPGDSVQNEVKGAVFYSPSCRELFVKRESAQALVLDRGEFDRGLAEEVEGSVDLKLGYHVKHVERSGGAWRVETNRGILECSILVDAEGARYRISGEMGMPRPSARWVLPAVQCDVSGVERVDPDLVEVYLGSRWAPGFFAWLIPLGEKTARIGLAARNRPLERLEGLLRHHPVVSERVEKASVLKRYGGRVVVAGPLKRIATEGGILLGDAACQTKPTTGGGVVLSGFAAKIAARALEMAIEESGGLEWYEREWNRLFRSDLACGKIARVVLSELRDEELDRLFALLREEGLEEVAARVGDFDVHSLFVREILRRPRAVLRSASLAARALARGLLGTLY